ncbi:17983_t:CDS:2, partial [Gigaspora rosea]
MDLLNKFCQLHGYLNDIKELDDKILSEQLEQFVVEVCKSNGQEYKASSLYTEADEIKLILAISTNDPKGSDAKHLKASWLKELDNGGMQLELPKQKNHAGGIKDPYAEA